MTEKEPTGRASGTARLEPLIEAVVEGRGSAQLIVGTSGVGKSAFLKEAGSAAKRAGVHTIHVTGALDGRERTNAVIEALLEVCAEVDGESISGLGDDDAAALLTATGRRSGIVSPSRVHQAVLQLLLAPDVATLLLVDDLHLFDESSVGALLDLSRHLSGERLGLVMTARPDRPWAEFVPACVAVARLEKPPAEVVSSTKQGRLRIVGVAASPDPSTRAPDDPMVAAFFAADPSGRLAVVTAAANELGLDLGSADTSRIEGLTVDNTGFAWATPSVREQAASSIDAAAMRRVHQALANSALIDDQQRAYHLVRARRAPDDETAQLLGAIGRAALERAGPAAAVGVLLDAAAFTVDPVVRADLLCDAGIAALQSNQLTLSRRVLEDCLALPASVMTSMRAVLSLGAVLAWGVGPAVAADRLRAHAATVSADGSPAGIYLASAASFDVMAARVTRAHETAVAACADAPDLISSTLSAAVWVQTSGLRGPHDRGVSDDEVDQRAQELAGVIGPFVDSDVAGAELPAQQLVAHWLGRDCVDDADAMLTRLIDSARRRGVVASFALNFRAELLWRTGRWNEATALMEHALVLEGPGLALAAVQATSARLRAFRGDGSAAALASEALVASTPVGAALFEAWALWALAVHAANGGDHLWALDCHDRISSIRRTGGAVQPGAMWSEPDRIDALIALDRRDEARAAADEFHELSVAARSRWGIAAAQRSLGELVPDDDQARTLLEASEAAFTALSYPFERARSALASARRLHRSAPEDAAAALGRARSTFARLDSTPWLARCDRLRPGGESAAPVRELLTPAEWRVALIASRGETTAAVASQLFLSRKTVESHLGSIYRKLGIANRSQLVRHMFESHL